MFRIVPDPEPWHFVGDGGEVSRVCDACDRPAERGYLLLLGHSVEPLRLCGGCVSYVEVNGLRTLMYDFQGRAGDLIKRAERDLELAGRLGRTISQEAGPPPDVTIIRVDPPDPIRVGYEWKPRSAPANRPD